MYPWMETQKKTRNESNEKIPATYRAQHSLLQPQPFKVDIYCAINRSSFISDWVNRDRKILYHIYPCMLRSTNVEECMTACETAWNLDGFIERNQVAPRLDRRIPLQLMRSQIRGRFDDQIKKVFYIWYYEPQVDWAPCDPWYTQSSHTSLWWRIALSESIESVLKKIRSK